MNTFSFGVTRSQPFQYITSLLTESYLWLPDTVLSFLILGIEIKEE